MLGSVQTSHLGAHIGMQSEVFVADAVTNIPARCSVLPGSSWQVWQVLDQRKCPTAHEVQLVFALTKPAVSPATSAY